MQTWGAGLQLYCLAVTHGRFMVIKQNVNVTLNVQQTGIVMLGARGVKEKVESPYLPLRAMRATETVRG